MSKQQKEKLEQGYKEKPVFPMCSNCISIHTEIRYPDPKYPNYIKEYNSCSLGGFKVKKQGTCNKHDFKPINH